jgi:hypothetical protein
MNHKLTALQSVKIRTSVTRQVESREVDRIVTRSHSQEEWVFLKAGEIHEGPCPVVGVDPDYLPNEKSVRVAGTPMIVVPKTPRPLEFHGLFLLEELENSGETP